MHALKNSARAGGDVVSPYRTMLLAWLRGMLAALLMTLIILLLAPIAASSAYATTESSDVQANAPPAIAQTIATTETDTVTSGDDSSEVTVVSTDEKSAVNETSSDLQESVNEQVDSNSSDPAGTTVDDSLANTNQSTDTSTGAGNSDAGASSNMGDSGYVPVVDPVITDTATTAITPVTDSTAITADDLNNAVGRDYQGVATDLENANQSLALATDTSSTSLDSRGEGNASYESPDDLIYIADSRPVYLYAWQGFQSDNTSVAPSTIAATVDPDTKATQIWGNSDDLIFDASTYIALRTASPRVDIGSPTIPATLRYGFNINKYVCYMKRSDSGVWFRQIATDNKDGTFSISTQYNATFASGPNKGNLMYSEFRIYPIYTYSPDALGIIGINLNGDSDNTVGADLNWDSALPLPGGANSTAYDNAMITTFQEEYPSYAASDFAGWYLQDDVDSFNESDTYHYPKAGATRVDGVLTVGQLLTKVYGLDDTSKSYDSNLINNIPPVGLNINIIACTNNSGLSYDVTYMTNGATSGSDYDEPSSLTADSYTIKDASDTNLNYSKTGYGFGGWTITDSEGGALKLPGGGTASSVTVSASSTGSAISGFITPETGKKYYFTAIWKQYTVIWAKEYSSASSITTSQTTHPSTFASPLADPYSLTSTSTQTDGSGAVYKFDGWYLGITGTSWTSATGSNALATGSSLSSLTSYLTDDDTQLTVYAIWKPQGVEYVITYDPNYSSSPAATTQSVFYNSSGSPACTDALGNQAVYKSGLTRTGYSLAGWSTSSTASSASYGAGDNITATQIASFSTSQTLYAVWVGDPINITYSQGTVADSTISIPTTSDTATIGTLKSLATNPTRDGYSFAGWLYGTTNIGTSYTFPDSTPSAVTLVADWTPKTYKVQFSGNSGTIDGASSYTATGTYGWNSTIATPLAEVGGKTLARSWYNANGWATSSTATSSNVSSTSTIASIVGSGATTTTVGSDEVVTLYVVWDPITMTVTYTTDGNGTVSNATDTVNLATGTGITGSTASPNTYYAFGSWTDAAGNTTYSTSSATYAPSINDLRTLYNNGSTSMTYRANFVGAKYAYSIDVYLQDATGSGYTKLTSITSPGGVTPQESYGTIVQDTDTVGSTALKDIYLNISSGSQAILSGTTNSVFATYNSSKSSADGKTQITISNTPANNVLELYYDLATYNLTATWGSTIPASYSGPAASSYLPTPSTGIRWGQTVSMTSTPSETGYTFAWSATTPSSASMSGTNLTLSAQDFKNLAGSDAVVTGTWTAQTFTIKLAQGANANAGLTLPSPASKIVSYGDTLDSAGTWVPTYTDNSSYTHFFAGWTNDGGTTILSSADLQALTVTQNDTYTSVWEEKIVISYLPGAVDSYGNSKAAAWTAETHSLGTTNISTYTIGNYTTTTDGVTTHPAIFAGTADASGNPKGAAGWTFDHWEDTSGNKYDAVAGGSNPLVSSLYLTKSYTFTAIWKADAATITYGTTGAVSNNTANTSTSITGTLPVTNPFASSTDAAVTLPTLTGVTAGYTHDGWAKTQNATAADFAAGFVYHVKASDLDTSGNLNLYPVFKENTVTLKYQIDSASTGRTGSISSGASETIYAVMHNAVDGTLDTQTASVTNTTGYSFAKWTWTDPSGASQYQAAALLDPITTISSGTVLTSGITYYAHFDVNDIVLQVLNTDPHGSVKTTDTANNELTVPYNTTVPAGQIDEVTADEGYELTGWKVTFTDGSSAITLSGNAANYAGLMAYTVTKPATLEPVFTVKTTADYKIYYDFGGAVAAGVYASDAGGKYRMATYNENVLPTVTADKTPFKAGYTFDGWFASTSTSDSIERSSAAFSDVYTASGYSWPDKTIFLYARFTESTNNQVIFDLFGNYASGTAHANDNVIYDASGTTPYTTTSKTGIKWTDTADTFVDTITRGGYDFQSWTASVNLTSGSVVTVTGITPSNLSAYDFGALAGNNDVHAVTLTAQWQPKDYTVTYDYDDGVRSTYAVTRGWATQYNYYNDPATSSAPTRTNYTFKGWQASYTNASGTQTGALVNSTTAQTLASILYNDYNATGITLKAIWTEDLSYIFQDQMVGSTGTTTFDSAAFSATNGDVIYLSTSTGTYGAPDTGVHRHYGYEFDNYTTTAASYTVSTTNTNNIYKVYYNVKKFDIEYYDESGTQLSSVATRTNVAWDSTGLEPLTAVTVPTGYSGVKWYYLDASGNKVYLASTTDIATIRGTDDDNTKPVKLYAEFEAKQVKILFQTDGTGTLSYVNTANGTSTVTVDAADASAVVPTVTATAGTNYKFIGWFWTTDPSWSDVTTLAAVTSTYANLATSVVTDDMLTPVRYAASSTDSTLVWHDIVFVARFVDASGQTVTVRHHFEDANGTPAAGETYAWLPTVTTTETADNNSSHTATAYTLTGTYAGYDETTLTATDKTHMVDSSDPTTLYFDIYYTAKTYQVSYGYDNTAPATVSQGIPATVSVKYGKKYYLATTPYDTTGSYSFNGWNAEQATDGTTVSVSSDTTGSYIVIPASNVNVSGEWERVSHAVVFANKSTEASKGSITMPSGGLSVDHGSTLKDDYSKNAVTDLGVTISPTKDSSGYELYYVSGWTATWTDELGNTQTATVSGVDAAMTYTINYPVTFYAIWADSYVVTYNPGAHGDFTQEVYDHLTSGQTTGYSFAGTQTPKSGWQYAGWGWKDASGAWQYNFDYDADVDYATDGVTPASGYTAATMPTDAGITSSIDYYAFFKALDQTITYSNVSYDGTKTGTWDANVTEAEKTVTAKTASSVTLLNTVSGTSDPVLTLDGYDLDGWTDGTTQYALGSPFTVPGNNVTLYPVWKVAAVQINYIVDTTDWGAGETWGTVDNSSDSILTDTDTIKGSTPSAKPGYRFVGWTLDPTAATVVYISDSTFDSASNKLTPTGRGTFYAVFAQKDYGFTLDDGVASGDPNQVTSMPSAPTDTLHWTDTLTLADPERPGYTFTGWKADPGSGATTGLSGGGLVSSLAKPDGDNTAPITLTATWEADEQTLTYKLPAADNATWTSGAEAGTNDDITENHDTGDAVTLKGASSVTRAGYDLVGWSTTQNDTSGSFSLTMPATSATLYPVWQAREYAVYFNDGQPATPAGAPSGWGVQSMPADQPIAPAKLNWGSEVPTTHPTLEGYEFKGWTVTDADGNVVASTDTTHLMGTEYTFSTLADNIDDTTHAKLTLTANWQAAKYRVLYEDSLAGTGAAMTAVAARTDAEWFGVVPGATYNPTKTGYTFTGWIYRDASTNDVDADGAIYSDIASIQSITSAQYVGATGDTSTTGITLYAAWKKNVDFKVRVVLEDADGNPASDAALSASLGYNKLYTSYEDVTVTVNAGGSALAFTYSFDGNNITAADAAGDGAVYAPVTSLTMPNIVGYTYDYISASSHTLAATDDPYEFILYFKPKTGYTVDYYVDATDATPFATRTPVTWGTDNLHNDASGSAVTPSKTGYELSGWTTTLKDGIERTLAATDIYGDLAWSEDTADHVKLVAVWTARKYNINYVDPVGSTGKTEPRVVDSSIASKNPASGTTLATYEWTQNVSFAAPNVANTNHDSGWKFLGWSTNPGAVYTTTPLYTSDSSATFESLFGAANAEKDAAYDADGNWATGYDGLTLYAVWAKYVPYSIEYYLPGETTPFETDTTSHTATDNPGIEGESSTVTTDEIKDHRPQGYVYDESASDPTREMTRDESTNVLKVTYRLRDDFEIIADYNGGAASGGATSSTTGGLTWFQTPGIPSSGFARNGYTFAGTWNTQADGLGTTFTSEEYGQLASIEGLDDETATETPVRLYAMWSENSDYVIDYDINNKKKVSGDATTNPNVITDVPSDKNPATPDDLEGLSWTGTLSGLADGDAMDAEPLGYHFGSWNTARDGSGLEVTSATTYEELSNYVRTAASTDPITLYAQWAEDEVEITYMPDGSGGTVTRSIDKISAVTGTAIGTGSSSGTQLTSVAVANPGWHFVRWRLVDGTNADPVAAAAELAAMAGTSGVNTTSVTGQTLSVAASSDDGILHAATYIAEFEENDPATLIYNPNGGTGSIDSVTEPYGTILTLADGTEYKRPYYTIASWNTKADGTGTTYALGYTGYELPEGTTTLYAQWKVNSYPVTISGTATGGTVTETNEDVEYNKTITTASVTASNPTPNSGMIFKGWTYTMTDAETGVVTTGTVSDPTELKVTGPVTFTALFEEDPNAVNETNTNTDSNSGTNSGNTTPVVAAGSSDGSSNSGGGNAGAYGAGAVKTGDADSDANGFAFAAIVAIMLAILIARRRREDSDECGIVVGDEACAGTMWRGARVIAVGFTVALICVALSAVNAQNAFASETADEKAVVEIASEDTLSSGAESTEEGLSVTAEETSTAVDANADEQKDAAVSAEVDDGNSQENDAEASEKAKDEAGAESQDADATKTTETAETASGTEPVAENVQLVADDSSDAAEQPGESAGNEIEDDSYGYAHDETEDEPTEAEDPVEPASIPVENTLQIATSVAAPTYRIQEGSYYLTGVTPVFGEYFVLDSSSSYLSVVKRSSSLSGAQQWEITPKTDPTWGEVYTIKSASNYYLYASNSGIASISTTASTDDGYYWLPVVTDYNGQEAVAFYNLLRLTSDRSALAMVTTKDATGTSITVTVETLACGNKSYPDAPDSNWLWYFTSVTPVAWSINYTDTTGASGSTASTQATDGIHATVASNGYSRPGYTFTGWNTLANGLGTSYAPGTSITYTNYDDAYSLDLYAQWKEDTATVTYAAATGGKVGLGTNGSANSNSVSETVGAATGVLTGTTSATFSGASAKASTGYHFGGWSSNGANAIDSSAATSTTITPTTVVRLTNYADSGSSVAIYHGVTVTANFDANTYTVAYDANGGTGTLTASSVTYGNNDTLSVASSALSQEGYSFSGWNTKADGSGVSVSDGATLSTSTLNQLITTSALADTNGASTTLYAQWTANPTPVVPVEPEEPTTEPTQSSESSEPTPTTVVTPVETPVSEPTPTVESSGSSGIVETIAPVVEAIAQTVEAAAQPVLEVTAATAGTLVTVGATIADIASANADGSTSFVDALSNLTPAEQAQAATTTVTAVAAVSTVAGIVGAGASIAGAVAGAGAIGAGAAGAVGAASAADITAELAAESALAGGFFVRLRRRIMALLGKEEPKEESDEEK